MIESNWLQALDAVLRHGQMEGAAQDLGLTASAVSIRIKRLEDSLGQPVLKRSRPLQATTAGQAVLKHFQQLQWLQAELRDAVQPLQSGNAFKPVSIGVNGDSVCTWFIQAIAPAALQHRLLLELHIDDQDHTSELLKTGQVMGCVSTRAKALQGCTVQKLGHMRYRAYASPSFIAQWLPDRIKHRIWHVPAVVYNEKDRLQHEWLKLLTGSRPGKLLEHRAQHSSAFTQMVCAGLGWGMFPAEQISREIETGALLPIIASLHLDVSLYWHRWRVESTQLDDISLALTGAARAVLM
jgi:LysR family transcriptional regulator, chromosome initiation inhibitor